MNRFINITPYHRIELYDKLIKPILLYGSEIWGCSKRVAIERIHTLFLKSVLQVKTTTQNDFVYTECGRIDLYSIGVVNMIKYWFKVINASEHKYINSVYKTMVQDIELRPRSTNWAMYVKNILTQLGFYHVWLNQGVENIPLFISLFRQRVRDTFIQALEGRVNDSSRALFYKSIMNFNFQKYLTCVNIPKYRIALSKLRLSSHRLNIEVGRWNNTPVNERLCTICNVLEDEYHFIFECQRYIDLRDLYIPRYFRIRPSMLKCKELLQSENVRIIRNLSMYVYKAFEIRSRAVQSN